MAEPEVITSGIVCPLCGRKEAVIQKEILEKNVYGTGKKQNDVIRVDKISTVYLFHDFCGYHELLSTFVEDFYRRQGFNNSAYVKDDHDDTAERMIIFNINKAADIPKAITVTNKLLQIINGYFTNYRFDLSDRLDQPICPICGCADFISESNRFYCSKRHFSISPIYFLPNSLGEPYTVQRLEYIRGATFSVSREEEYSPEESRKHHERFFDVEVARIVYQYNSFNKTQLLIVERLPKNIEEDFQKLMVVLHKKFDHLCTVIEKEPSK